MTIEYSSPTAHFAKEDDDDDIDIDDENYGDNDDGFYGNDQSHDSSSNSSEHDDDDDDDDDEEDTEKDLSESNDDDGCSEHDIDAVSQTVQQSVIKPKLRIKLRVSHSNHNTEPIDNHNRKTEVTSYARQGDTRQSHDASMRDLIGSINYDGNGAISHSTRPIQTSALQSDYINQTKNSHHISKSDDGNSKDNFGEGWICTTCIHQNKSNQSQCWKCRACRTGNSERFSTNNNVSTPDSHQYQNQEKGENYREKALLQGAVEYIKECKDMKTGFKPNVDTVQDSVVGKDGKSHHGDLLVKTVHPQQILRTKKDEKQIEPSKNNKENANDEEEDDDDEDDNLPMMSLKSKNKRNTRRVSSSKLLSSPIPSSSTLKLSTSFSTTKESASATTTNTIAATANIITSSTTTTNNGHNDDNDTNTKKPKAKPPSSSSSSSHSKSKLFCGTLRSAAAAHRNRQIHVPPIGSPGLLMIPTAALMSSLLGEPTCLSSTSSASSLDDEQRVGESNTKEQEDFLSKWLHNGYLLPRTVFEQSMIQGGYTLERRRTHPHRGSSTERTVGDMFDSDASGLYLHFPELIPLEIWEKRLGGKRVESEIDGAADTIKNESNAGNEGKKNDTNIGNIKKEMEDEISDNKQPILINPTSVNEESKSKKLLVDCEGSLEENKENALKNDSVDSNSPLKGRRLVDVVILSLRKLLGDKVCCDNTPNLASMMNPDPIPSNSISTKVDEKYSQSQMISKDLTLEDLPQFNPPFPSTRKRCRPYQPMSFLDMIPISLTSTYPPDYVAKRRAYAEAVKIREHAIIESQEAADDAVDNREKYQAHKAAWDRMFEYQKQQIAKREAMAEESERDQEAEGRGNNTDGNDRIHVTSAEESVADQSVKKSDNDRNADKISESKEEREREDPMDYMPPIPQPPPPERIVYVPDVPTPPSPPLLVEVDENDRDFIKKIDLKENKMYVPKMNHKLLQHLDPSLFLPTMEGRYFGLLSNTIADPQFVGPNATGIRGVTSGGGTGLATSYAGGGRGAAGLVSGPLRGGLVLQQQLTQQQQQQQQQQQAQSLPLSAPISIPSNAGSTLKATVKKQEEDPVIAEVLSESIAASSTVADSSKKNKKRLMENEETKDSGDHDAKKKPKRVIPLATGDRNTTATEIAAGPAGPDFPEGWTVKTYRRAGGETIGKTDRFWFSPGLNIRFRARKHAMSFIDILTEPGINGDEDAAADAYRLRGLHF